MTSNKRVGRVEPHGDGDAGRDATRTDVIVKRALVDAPITPEKRMAFRLWFALVALLEYKIVKKQLALQPRGADGDYLDHALWSRFTMRTQWLNIMINMTIDLCTLFYLNALHPRWGLRRPSDGNGAAELMVPASVPLLARHLLKLTHRVPPLNTVALGIKWWCFHGSTLQQTLLMSLSPSFFATAFNRFSFGGLALMGLVNSVFIAVVSYTNRDAYICFEEQRARFLQALGGEYVESKFLVVGVPIAFLAPFLFDDVQKRPSVSRALRVWGRLNGRLFFGAASRSRSGFTPLPAGAFARRLRSAVSIVVHVVAALVAAVSMANGAPVLLVIAAAWAQTTVPRKVFAQLSASVRWRDAIRANRNGSAAAAARWTISFAFALTAAATTVAAKMLSTGANFDAASSSRTWAAAFATVAAAMHACTPGVSALAACVGAALDAAVFVAGRAVIDPTGGFDASAARLSFIGSYACALHLNDALTFARRAAAWGPGRWFAKRRVAASGVRAANDHWRLEDFVVDPVRFELRAAKDVQFEDRHRFKPMAYDASMKGPPRIAEKLTCRATNCRRQVDERNLMAAGAALCLEHLTSKEPFEYGPLNRAALFCLMCRRVHTAPICRESVLFSGREIAKVMIGSAGTPCARDETGKKDVFLIHASLKTEEGPMTAVNRARGVFQDTAAENPGLRHAVMSTRPGCTIVSVDMVSDDCGEDGDSDVHIPSGSNRLESSGEEWTDAVERFVSLLARNGSRREVQGTLYFRAVNPRTGAMRTRRIVFRAEDEGVPHVGPVEDASTLARLDCHPTLRHAIDTLHNPRKKVLVVRSDRFDEVRLPTPPPGFHYVLRLEGTYLPLSMPDDERHHTATSTDTNDEVDVVLPPTRSEGLGFFELVKSLDLTGGDELSEAAEVILTLPVFMTPDTALAHELSRDRDSGGACMEHVPVLFDLGASLRKGGVVSSDIELLEASRNFPGSTNASIQQIIFHAACACAAQGWLIALTRVLDVHEGITLNDADDRGDSAPRQMSTDPDTATDGSTRSRHLHGEGMFVPTLRTKHGLWGLLRSACSSGDATIVKAVAVMAIRHRGAVEVAELMCACDPTFISPLHATAMAIARRVRKRVKRSGVLRNLVGGVAGGVTTMSPPVKSAIEAAIFALTVASDPLAWVSGTTSSAQESPMAFASRHVSVRGVGSRRASREISAANTRVIDALADAVVHSMRAMQNSRFARHGGSQVANDGSVDAMHANTAATFVALSYDGSPRATIAAALLSPGSSHYHGAFRRRDADESRGEVGLDEARAWLLAGASPYGFPPASATETRSGRLGMAAVAAAVAMDATLALVAGDGAGALAAAVTAALMATAVVAAKTKHRRLYLCHHLRANAVARLAAFVVAVAVASVESSWSTASASRVAACVAQAWVAPAGTAADAVIVGAHAMVVGAPWWVAAIAAGTVAAASVADDRRARGARERLAKAA